MSSSVNLMEVGGSVSSNLNRMDTDDESKDDEKWLDLIPDRNLLDANFEGYKLSLDPFVQYKINIGTNLLDTYNYFESGDASESSTQKVFLYQHLKLYGMQNLLIVNQFDDSSIYYFDVNGRLVKIVYNRPKLMPVRTIVPTNLLLSSVFNYEDIKLERTNATMKFLSHNISVIYNGFDMLALCQIDEAPIKSEDPLIQENWKVLFKYQTTQCDSSANTSTKSSILKDVVQYENFFHVMLINVVESKETSTKFDTLIHWFQFEQRDDWKMRRYRCINCFNVVPDYVAFETNGESVFVSAPSFVQFVFDSEKPIQHRKESKLAKKTVNEEVKKEEYEKFYNWSQTQEELNVNVLLDILDKNKPSQEEKLNKSDVKVEFKTNAIEVVYKGNPILSGTLYSSIKIEESTWTLNDAKNIIEIDLIKVNANQFWTSFLKDQDKCGSYTSQIQSPLIDTMTSDTVQSEAKPSIFTLEQQLEECDGIFDDQAPMSDENDEDKLLMLRRLDGNTHNATHKTFINDNKFLFDVKTSPNKSAAICLRHDVDGILWQPHRVSYPSSTDTVWLTHDHTFLAFGYVQASKQDAKYRTSSPDCSYVCIVDSHKHIYVYKQSSEKVETQLKNRKTGKLISHVAKQYLISLDSDQEVFGIHCSNDFMIVLLKEACYIYKINPNTK